MIRITELSLPLDHPSEALRQAVLRRLKIGDAELRDFCVFKRSLAPSNVRGRDVELVVEIADTSLAYDRGLKVEIYTAYGVHEVWVIDAITLGRLTVKL